MKIVDFPSNLFFHTDPRRSVFLKEIKRILIYFGVPFADPCCTNNPTPPTYPVCTDGVTILGNGLPGNCLHLGTPPPSFGGPFVEFYGLTAGTGNGGPTDYAATVAVKTSVGTGRVPFPRNGAAAAGSAVRIDGSSFTLPNIGTYLITFGVQTTEPGQLELELNGLDLPATATGNQNPTSGGHRIGGTFIITTTVINSVLAVVNPEGNSPALTIVPADGASTHANAQTLTITQIA
jgi:hypothetical protein